jgi:hypothetical protein
MSPVATVRFSTTAALRPRPRQTPSVAIRDDEAATGRQPPRGRQELANQRRPGAGGEVGVRARRTSWPTQRPGGCQRPSAGPGWGGLVATSAGTQLPVSGSDPSAAGPNSERSRSQRLSRSPVPDVTFGRASSSFGLFDHEPGRPTMKVGGVRSNRRYRPVDQAGVGSLHGRIGARAGVQGVGCGGRRPTTR